ncbi:hypothetical protein AABB24_024269 [Solanum stoloniferum]|uniref:Uncharacterized protein n=1 Tax=Solanum stoloniferum TaxID=62892 RepID=A0ABD2SMY3_9SOLN
MEAELFEPQEGKTGTARFQLQKVRRIDELGFHQILQFSSMMCKIGLAMTVQYSFDQEQSRGFCQENRGVSNSECGVQDNQQEVNYDIPIQNFNLFSSSDGFKIPFLSELQSYPHSHFLNFQSLQDDTILSSGNHHHQGSFLTTTSVNHFPSVLSQNQVFSHREPLQSSFFPLMSDPLSTQLETLSYGFANDGFSGLISSASRIQGEEEQATFFSAS